MQRLTIETKVLKQLVRDIIQPERDLGHSDRKGHKIEPNEKENASNEISSVKTTESNSVTTREETEASASITTASQPREVAETPCEDCQ